MKSGKPKPFGVTNADIQQNSGQTPFDLSKERQAQGQKQSPKELNRSKQEQKLGFDL